jgi:P-type Cu2+ transporter
MPLYTYHVPGMRGPCCINKVKRAAAKSPFYKYPLKDDDIKLVEKTVTFHVAEDDALNTCEPGKLQALFDEALRAEGLSCALPHARLGALGLSAGLLVLLLPLFVPGMPLALLGLLSFASVGLTLALGAPFYRAAYHDLRAGDWTMDTLFSISTAVILSASVAALFFPALPMMLEAGLLIFGFRHTGIAIIDEFKARANKKNTKLKEDKPSVVKRYRKDGTLEEVALTQIKRGDRLCVSVGERLPVDGVFGSGEGRMFNGYQTGSYQSEALPCNTTMYEGTELLEVVGGTSLVFDVEQPVKDSFLARLEQDVARANVARTLKKEKPEPNTMAYWLHYFIRAVLGIAVFSGVAVGVWFASPVLGIQVAVSVLVAACPCTLGLIAPLVMRFCMKKMENMGFSIRKPEHVEKLDALNAVLCDVHGLFTHGVPLVNLDLSYAEGGDVNKLLAQMAQLEASDEHPAARAIKKAANSYPGNFEGGAVTRLTSRHGELHVSMDGADYALGNKTQMEALKIPLGQLELKKPLALGESVVYLMSNNKIQGYLVLQDPIRKGAKSMIRAFRDAGIAVYLCTGADDEVAQLYAGHLGIHRGQVFSACRPHGDKTKVNCFHELKKQYKNVGFLGDGLNDAEVLGACDFGLFLNHDGAPPGGQQGASVELKSETLYPVEKLLNLVKKTTAHINQNVGFSFLYNIMAVLAPMGLMFGLGFALNPAVCAGLMMVQALLIFANVYYRFELEEEPNPEMKRTSASSDLNTNISSGLNGVGLTNTDHQRLHSERVLDGGSDGCCNGLNQLPSSGCY